ncbi:fumarylacetoacetate hydrolase family protein [Virgisporangium ochraceum]|uniref:fumarylacetoacetase n=1 Tax=Virgisporangium ochraceum TaxID=65505 RepID=A0A8J3ZMZ4_9ACTN|nr:fumarylacetoacetate hydrolase family protein [Virgisporangium ochraceum]GIJ67264.1 fumarylacetoacetase [Virgisporangium ochraceum]
MAEQYGAFTTGTGPPRIGVRTDDHVLDLTEAAHAQRRPYAHLVEGPTLNPLMAAGPEVWAQVREDVGRWEPTIALSDVTPHLPFEVADYVDFYSSENHAANVGRIFRPGGDPLPPNWKHLPIGYHGRAGTVVVSGTDVVRPRGQRKAPDDPAPTFGPTRRLDIEAEVGFVVGVPATRPVPLGDFDRHVFGVVLLNDWSARDIQAWEYVPLGPFLGKSFATSVSAWVTPLAALDGARTRPPARTGPLLPYLDDTGTPPWGLDLTLEVELNGTVVSRPPFATMYWTPAQQLAHLTVNGATLRTGDLFASGTVSGPAKDELGSLLELSWGGRDEIATGAGKRTFLEDGDEVVLRATATNGVRLGEVTGRIRPHGA